MTAGDTFILILSTICGILGGVVTYEFLRTGYAKYGVGDTVDKVQSILMGISIFLLAGAFLSV